MKLVSAVLAYVAGIATTTNAELRGYRKLEKSHKGPAEDRKVPPGAIVTEILYPESIVTEPLTDPSGAPTEIMMECSEVGTQPFKIDQYVVLQYNSTLNVDLIDFEDKDDQLALDVYYRVAAKRAQGDCDQKGARNEVLYTEFLAHNKKESTFLLRLIRYTNSIADIFASETNEDCGPIIYNTTDPAAVNFDKRRLDEVDTVVDLEQEQNCTCSAPTAMDVIKEYNIEIQDQFNITNFILGTDQLCEDLDCKKKTETFYRSSGVCLGEFSLEPSEAPSESQSPSEFPSEEPSESPTLLDSSKPSSAPTGAPSLSPSKSSVAPTSAPTGAPTKMPTKEPTKMPTKEPTGAPVEPTGAPVEPTGAPVEPTGAPVEPTGAPVEPTGAPVEPTGAPVEPTGAPVEPTGAPVEPTGAPVEPTEAPFEPTGAPVEPTEAPAEPTEAPVEPTEAPVEPTEAPVEPTEAPVEPTEAPVEPTEAPVEPTEAPVSTTD